MGLIGAVVLGAVFAVGLEGLGALGAPGRPARRPGDRRRDPRRALTACVALGLAWIAGSVALQTPGLRNVREDVRRSEILNKLNDVAAAVGADPQGAGPLRPAAADPRAVGRRAARRPGAILRDPQVRADRALDPAGDRDGVRAGDRGLGLDGAGRPRRHQRPRRRRRERHPGAGRRQVRVRVGARRSASTRPTTSRCCAWGGSAIRCCRRSGSPGRSRRGAPPRSWATRRTGRSTCARPAWARCGPSARRTPTAAARSSRSILSFRGLVRSGNSGGPLVDSDGQVVGDRLRRGRRRHAQTAGSPCPTPSCRRRCPAHADTARSTPGPARADAAQLSDGGSGGRRAWARRSQSARSSSGV